MIPDRHRVAAWLLVRAIRKVRTWQYNANHVVLDLDRPHGRLFLIEQAVRNRWFALWACRHCHGSRIENILGYENSVIEIPCSMCAGTGHRTRREIAGVAAANTVARTATALTWCVRQAAHVHPAAWFVVVALLTFTAVLVLT